MNKHLCLSLAVAVSVTAFNLSLPTTGWAQSEIAEITVTTRKRSENLQDVPISIQALTAEDLQRSLILGVADLAMNTPGLSLEQQGAGGFLTPVIRGMAQNVIGSDLSYDNNVGIFVNGIYQSGRNSVNMELIGIDRIEVARGPQSALFGRSTFAGAINYVYADPTDEFSGSASVTAGTDEDYGATVDISGPLVEDKLNARISMGYREFDGTFKNLAGGDNLQGYDSSAIAGALVFTPNDSFTATLNMLHSDRTNEQDAQWLVALNCGDNGFGTPTYYCGDLKAQGDVDMSPEGHADSTLTQASLKLEYATDNFVLTSITAATEADYKALLDRDYGSLALGTGLSLDVCTIPDCFSFFPPPTVIRTDMGIQSYAHTSSETEDFSQEFRISSVGTEGISWMAGVFLYDSETLSDTQASLGNSQLGFLESYTGFFAPPFLVDDPVNQANPFNTFTADTKAWAVFAQLGWDITDQLTLTGEARYTDEEKETHVTYLFVPTDDTFKRSFDYVTPRLTLTYTPEDDMLIYASAAKGVRTGGINGSVTGCSPFGDPFGSPPSPACLAGQAGERFFEPEENWTYELGAKTTIWDNRLQINSALYLTDWTDLQLPALNADFFGTHVTNVDGGVDVWGFEIDGTALLTDMITLSASFAYTKPEFKNNTFDGSVVSSCGTDGSLCTIGTDSEGRPAADVSGQTLGRVAEKQANIGLTFDGDIGSRGLNWYVQTNVNYQSENHARSINSMTYGERTLVDMRAAILNDRYEIALWAKNMFDEEYTSSQALQPGFDGNRRIDAYQGNGRRVGVTATVNF